MAPNLVHALIILNTKTGGNSAASRCLWQALRKALF